MIEPTEVKKEIVERPRNIQYRSIVPIGTEVTAQIAANGTVAETFKYKPMEPCAPGKILRCLITIDFVEDDPAPGEV